MTRKDYELVAQTIRFLDLSREDRAEVTTDFRKALSRHYPNFNAQKFNDACMEPTALDRVRMGADSKVPA